MGVFSLCFWGDHSQHYLIQEENPNGIFWPMSCFIDFPNARILSVMVKYSPVNSPLLKESSLAVFHSSFHLPSTSTVVLVVQRKKKKVRFDEP